MTNTVTYMTHSVDRPLIAKLFAKFANKYGKLWTGRLGDNGDWDYCLDDWHQELQGFTLEQLRAAVNKALSIYKEFPPTQGQLIELCVKESGVPDVREVIRMMVNREFNHPLVKMVYEKIGSWTLANGKEAEIQNKVKQAYDGCMAEFVFNPQVCWEKLTVFHYQPKLEAPTSKIPSKEERIGFAERMKQYTDIARESLLKLKDQKHPEFPDNVMQTKHRDFDYKVYQEYKNYLLTVPERLVLSLPVRYAHDRVKFLYEVEVNNHLKKSGYDPSARSSPTEPPKGSNKPTKLYKNWTND